LYSTKSGNGPVHLYVNLEGDIYPCEHLWWLLTNKDKKVVFCNVCLRCYYWFVDLWLYSAHRGPTSRSGHRMVHYKKYLIIFGGFH